MKIIFARHDQQGKKPNISEKNKKKKKREKKSTEEDFRKEKEKHRGRLNF